MRHDDFPDVDFVLAAPDKSADEDLLEPRDREFPRLRRLKRPAAYLLVLAAVVFGIVKLSTLRGSSHLDASSESADRASASSALRLGAVEPSVAIRTLDLNRGRGLISDDGRGSDCPAPHACLTSTELPQRVLDTVSGYFPGARLIFASTVELADPGAAVRTVWYREAHLTARGISIDLRVEPRKTGTREALEQTPDSTGVLAYVTHLSGTHEVQLTVHLPTKQKSQATRVHSLASDDNLLAPS